jgi:hypothetical protein
MKRRVTKKALGILNHLGDPWTFKTFETRDAAAEYIKQFWKGIKNPPDMSEHRIVPVIIIFSKQPQQ